MDLYSTILKNGGKWLNDGSAWRDIDSKDGTKVIRQIVKATGECAIDVFQKSNNTVISSFRKTMKPDGKSFSIRSFNCINGTGTIQGVLKLEKPGSFMQTLFKTDASGKIKPSDCGDFLSKAEDQIKRGKVKINPIGNNIDTKSQGLALYIQAFNKLFGKHEKSIF